MAVKFRQYDHVVLSNGLTGILIEVFGDGEAYLFERDDAPGLDDDIDPQFTVTESDIDKVLQ